MFVVVSLILVLISLLTLFEIEQVLNQPESRSKSLKCGFKAYGWNPLVYFLKLTRSALRTLFVIGFLSTIAPILRASMIFEREWMDGMNSPGFKVQMDDDSVFWKSCNAVMCVGMRSS